MLNTKELFGTKLTKFYYLPFYVGILALVATKLGSALSHGDRGYFLTLKLQDGKRVNIRENNFSLTTYPTWCIEFQDQLKQYQLRMARSPSLFVAKNRASGGTFWEECKLLI